MKDKNVRSYLIGTIILIVGIVAIAVDYLWMNSEKAIGISIGCSLLASSIVIITQTYLQHEPVVSPLDEWKLETIYKARSEKSTDSDITLPKVKKHLDIVAFGLSSFRADHEKLILLLLKKGVNIRILTMNPTEDNPFLLQREREEDEVEGSIRKSILRLVEWANNLNSKVKTRSYSSNSRGHRGKIEIRGYNCMTLDFYWRQDDEVYVGPYWYKMPSQKTITFRFKKGEAFYLYTRYFERLWNASDNVILTNQ